MTAHAHPEASPLGDHPTSVPELVASERLVLWTFRKLVNGQPDWPTAEKGLRDSLGSNHGLWAMRAAIGLVSRIARGARRRMRCHKPCCPHIAPDEVSILLLVQASSAGDRRLAELLAGWLVHPAEIDDVIEAAERLGCHFAAGSMPLPLRALPARPCPTAATLRTVH